MISALLGLFGLMVAVICIIYGAAFICGIIYEIGEWLKKSEYQYCKKCIQDGTACGEDRRIVREYERVHKIGGEEEAVHQIAGECMDTIDAEPDEYPPEEILELMMAYGDMPIPPKKLSKEEEEKLRQAEWEENL